MRWSFRPPLWAIAGTAVFCLLFVRAGFWQVHRGEQKKQIEQQYAASAVQPPVSLSVSTPAAQHDFVLPAQAVGRYLDAQQLLVDSAAADGRPGYDVLSPLALEDGGLLMVNRGWVPQTGAQRGSVQEIAAPSGTISVRGLWRSLPEPGLRLGDAACTPAQPAPHWPLPVLYPTVADLQCLYHRPVLAGELLLAAEQPGGYRREWPAIDPGFPPVRHYAYAAQWFALAVVLLFLFLRLNLKRVP